MSVPALLLFLFGAALAAFGWWGTYTPAGRQRFDEMAGMIPLGAFWLGTALCAIAVLGLAIAALRSRG